jgi:hypothetical protein
MTGDDARPGTALRIELRRDAGTVAVHRETPPGPDTRTVGR